MTVTATLATYDLERLAGQYTPLVRKTHQELAGPCPICGGTDRFLVKPQAGHDGRGIWTCHSCRDFQWSDAIGLVQFLGLAGDFRSACTLLRLDVATAPRALPDPVPPPPCAAPDILWQCQAEDVARAAVDALWSDVGAKARRWLAARGFADDILAAAGIGFHAQDTFDDPRMWGLPADHKKLCVPRGITIPWVIDHAYWRLSVRRALSPAQEAQGEPKYRGPAGQGNGLYRSGAEFDPARPTVLVEGEFDALAVWQATGGTVNAVALGSTTGARRVRWLSRLAPCPIVLVATDHDPDPAKGEQAAQYWLQALPHARRWRPYLKDCAAMLQAGMDIEGWVDQGLIHAEAQKAEVSR